MTTLTTIVEPPHRLPRAACAAIRATIAAGRETYVRERHLPRLIPMDPADLAAPDAAPRRFILARLARALRAERNRGRAGHWTYDLNRHIALKQAYSAEREILKVSGGGGQAQPAAANLTAGR